MKSWSQSNQLERPIQPSEMLAIFQQMNNPCEAYLQPDLAGSYGQVVS